MATWLVPVRARLRLDLLPSRLWLHANHLNVALQSPSPASLEIETMPYPNAHPDASVFEPMSDEYTSVPASGAHSYAPLSSSQTLASLVSNGDFHAAQSLRNELISHHIPIPHDRLYLHAALHALKERRKKMSSKERLDAFAAWLSLAPDRDEEWHSFYFIQHGIFWSKDHLNLPLVYRFGLVLASKGYYSDSAAMRVVSTLSRYAQTSVLEKYLREIEDTARDYHTKKGIVPPSDLLSSAYSLSIRTVALAGKGGAAFALISMAHSRGIHIPDFTLNIAVIHAPDPKVAMDKIRAVYPSWTMRDTNTYPVGEKDEPIPEGHTVEIAGLAARLRSLRTAFRSSYPPSPHALRSFITSYLSLGRTRAPKLLRSLAHRHSPKSASTWVFTEMLHHRSRRDPIRLLIVFSRYFHPVGVPRKTLLSLLRTRGKEARKEHVKRWVVPPWAMNDKLWPSAYHTALVWEAILMLSPKTEKERLYVLLLSLVRQSREPEPGGDRPRVQLPPDAFDVAHFSPFVVTWARRDPARAARVLRDMAQFGIVPGVVQWSMVARGYAQHDDPVLALRILDHFVETQDDEGVSDEVLGAHTNVLRGCIVAGDVRHAREVERRLVARLGYRVGDRPATDACLALLRALEARLRRVDESCVVPR